VLDDDVDEIECFQLLDRDAGDERGRGVLLGVGSVEPILVLGRVAVLSPE
jgi:hypothetical protein